MVVVTFFGLPSAHIVTGVFSEINIFLTRHNSFFKLRRETLAIRR